jgi:hypothetical protein
MERRERRACVLVLVRDRTVQAVQYGYGDARGFLK